MKLLLIGGTGLIGQEICLLLREKGIQFHAPSREELDLEKTESIVTHLEQYLPNIVVNTASYSDHERAENEPSKCFRVNRDAVSHLADCCHKMRAVLIHTSTYLVFDGTKKEAYTEKDSPNPTGVLASSQWQAEQQISERCLRHIILRLSWIISDKRNNLLSYLLNQITREKEVSVVSDQQGCPTPSEDAARVIVAIVQQLECGSQAWGTYHYASSDPVSKNNFAEIVISEASQYQPLTIRKLHMDKISNLNGIQAPANATLSCRKILNAFGVHNRPWRNILARLIHNYYDNQHQQSNVTTSSNS